MLYDNRQFYREYGEFGLRDFLEVKAVIGVDAA